MGELGALGVVVLILLVVILFSPIGLGGGLLYVPILHYVGGLPFDAAILGSLGLVFCVAFGSGFAHEKGSMANKSLVKKAIVTAIPCAIVGAFTSLWVIDEISENWVKLFALMLSAWSLYQTGNRILKKDEEESQSSEFNHPIYVTGTGVGGFACGFLGIGGGGIYVTMNRGWGGLGLREAVGTSFLIAACVEPIAFSTHLLAGDSWAILSDTYGTIGILLTFIIAIITAYLSGSIAIKYIPEKVIIITFVLMITLSLLRYATDLLNLL